MAGNKLVQCSEYGKGVVRFVSVPTMLKYMIAQRLSTAWNSTTKSIHIDTSGIPRAFVVTRSQLIYPADYDLETGAAGFDDYTDRGA